MSRQSAENNEIERPTLQTVETAAGQHDRPRLFACLAANYAAVRAKAAETLLKLHVLPGQRMRGGLARDFGGEPDAITKPLFTELAGFIGWQPTPAWTRFLSSLVIGMDEWRDGIGYDLDALAAMNPEERAMIRQWMRSRLSDPNHSIDWRELEAAAALGDTELLDTLTKHPENDIRLRVQQLLGDGAAVEKELCRALEETGDLGELSRALDMIPSYPSKAVKRALIKRLRKNDDYFVPAAMTLLTVFAGLDEWAERPFLFRVKEEGPDGPLMKQLLDKAGK